uniref:Uncharacterized protein n=1 Tax=Dulem virus 42 TaxID=3145760 RepID=A0AAU8B8Y4_9CAUD
MEENILTQLALEHFKLMGMEYDPNDEISVKMFKMAYEGEKKEYKSAIYDMEHMDDLYDEMLNNGFLPEDAHYVVLNTIEWLEGVHKENVDKYRKDNDDLCDYYKHLPRLTKYHNQ